MEIWKDVVGYEGRYKVSNMGNVKSLIGNEKYLKKSITENGYYVVSLSRDKKAKFKKVHRLVLESFIGLSDSIVDHKNRIKTDNRLENIEYVSENENMLRRIFPNKSSIYRGVYFHSGRKSWCVKITINRKSIHIGYFKTEEEANNAYILAADKLIKKVKINHINNGYDSQ